MKSLFCKRSKFNPSSYLSRKVRLFTQTNLNLKRDQITIFKDRIDLDGTDKFYIVLFLIDLILGV